MELVGKILHFLKVLYLDNSKRCNLENLYIDRTYIGNEFCNTLFFLKSICYLFMKKKY